MKGEPLENMKYALTLLIGSLRNSGAEVSLLSFTDSVDAVIEKESDTDKLLEFISEMGVGGGTDLEIPLAYTEKIGSKILILFTDGENGKESKLGASRVGLRNLIYLANEMKRYGYKIYILGYPRNIDYRILLMYMATPGCYYEIEEPEELLRVFGYIKNDIFEHEYETLSVFCPVDVEIEYNGEKLDSKSNKESSFGYMMGSDKTGSKIFKLKKDLEYNIKITGNGYGYMTIVHTDENGEKIFGKVGVPVNRGDTLEFKLNDLEKTVYSIDELNLIQWVTRLSRIGIISSITFISLAGITIYILIHRKWKIAVIIGIFTIIAPISIISIGRIHHNLEHCGSVFETWFDIDVGLIEYDYAHLTDVSITLNYFEIKDVMETFIDGYNTQNMDKMLSIFSHAYRADSTRNKILNFGDKIYSYKIKDITKNKFDDFEYSYELVHDIIVESTSISEYEYIGFDKHDIVSVVKIEMDINGDEYAMYMLLENTGSIDLRQSHWRILEIKEGNSDGQSIIAHVMDSWTNFIYTMYKR